MSNTLYLTIKKEWFFKILDGSKKIEYREIKPYWSKRLMLNDKTFKKFDFIKFRNGYGKNAPILLCSCGKIGITRNRNTDLGKGKFFFIEIDEVIGRANIIGLPSEKELTIKDIQLNGIEAYLA